MSDESGEWATPRDFAIVGGIRIHYALDGPRRAPTLALVNMASHNLTSWEPVLDTLTATFRVLRFDIRGTGRSEAGADRDFTFAHYADDLVGLLDTLEIDRAFVVGIAYGARTAARFAIRHPDRLAALGLFDVSLTPPVEQSMQRELGAQARQLLAEAGETPPVPRKSWRFYLDRESARLAHTAHEHEADPTELLHRVRVPTLVACGRQDANLAQARRIANAIPGADFEIMERTGHASTLYRPALFCELLEDFWARRGR